MNVLDAVVLEAMKSRDNEVITNNTLLMNIQKATKRGVEFDIVTFVIERDEEGFIQLNATPFNYEYTINRLQEIDSIVQKPNKKLWLTADICFEYLVKNINQCNDIESFLYQTPWTTGGLFYSVDDNDVTFSRLLDLNQCIESGLVKYYNPLMNLFWDIPFCKLDKLRFRYAVIVYDAKGKSSNPILISENFGNTHIEELYKTIFDSSRKVSVVLKNLSLDEEFKFSLFKLYYPDSYKQCRNGIIKQILDWECC